MSLSLRSPQVSNGQPDAFQIFGVWSKGILILGAWAILFGLPAPLPASAQQTDAPSVAEPNLGIVQSAILTIDRDLLFRQSLYGKRILAELEVERRRLASEARKVDAALAAEENTLTEQRASLSAADFRALADAFDAKVKRLREERPAQEQEFTRRFEQERVAYFEKIGAVLGAIVRERGGVVILDRRAILLTTQNIDITDVAIDRIDAQLGDGSLGQANAPDAPVTTDSTEN